MANNLTLTNPTYDTSTAKFGTGALNGGYGTVAAGVITATPLAWECWFKGTTIPNSLRVIMGNSGSIGWIGMDTAGKIVGYMGKGGGFKQFASSAAMTDGAWHHVAISTDGTFANTNMYLDGVAVPSTGTTGTAVVISQAAFSILADGASAGSAPFPGEVDEAAIWTTNRYTAAFTPPTSAYTGSESGLLALYHLDSNGTDSSGAAPSPATAITLTGPSSGTVNVASSNFTVAANGTTSASVTVALNDGGAGGTFIAGGQTVTSVTLAAGTNPSATFTYTPGSTGQKTISVTNNGSLTNPSALTYTANAASNIIPPNNAAIQYSPWGWLTGSAAAKTINPGQYFRTAFPGSSPVLNFDVSANASPLPQIWYKIDGLYWQVARVAATVALTMPSETAAWSLHTIEVWVKATSEFVSRWSPQSASVIFTGITLANGATLSAPSAPYNRAVMVIGDSIPEGYHTVNANGSGSDDVLGSDSRLSWATLLRDLLGVEVGVIAFGGQGVLGGGQGGVPPVTQSFTSLWSGQARDFSKVPDLVITNIGGNDRGASSSNFVPGYVTHLNQIISNCPGAKIMALRPFAGAYASVGTDIQSAISQCSNPSLVTYVDLLSTFDTSLSVDATHPLGVANIKSIAPAVAAAARPLLLPRRFTISVAA